MRRVVMVVCAALLFVPIYMKSRANQKMSDRAAFQVLSSGKKLVKVSGEVRYPGIYEVPANTLADSVINMAGPLQPLESGKPGFEKTIRHGSAVNIIRQLDGSNRIVIGQMAVSERMVLGIPLDIETMNEADFDRLPGIGPALAKRIVQYRHNNGGFLGVEDLANVNGIGEKKFEMIRSYMQLPVNVE
jgi:competence protein ComEA